MLRLPRIGTLIKPRVSDLLYVLLTPGEGTFFSGTSLSERRHGWVTNVPLLISSGLQREIYIDSHRPSSTSSACDLLQFFVRSIFTSTTAVRIALLVMPPLDALDSSAFRCPSSACWRTEEEIRKALLSLARNLSAKGLWAGPWIFTVFSDDDIG